MKIQAGEGVIVVGNPGTYDIPECTTDITYTNLLNGMDYPDYVSPTEGDYANLLFTDDLSFHSIEENAPCFAGTAYLHIPSDCLTTNTEIVNVSFEDVDDTDISVLENAIYTELAECKAGATIELPVKLKNELTPVGCTFTIALPDGVRLEKDADGDVVYELADRARKQWATLQDLGNGIYECTLTPSTAAATIAGSDGTLITLRALVPEGMAAGDYRLLLANCKLQSKVDGAITDHTLSNVTTRLTISDHSLGDVDGDGRLSFTDVAMTITNILGREQSGFDVNTADMNGDGRVTITDAVIIINNILKQGQANE